MHLAPQPTAARPVAGRRGISLLEVLVAMFVLLFGLMGLMAMIPIGHYYQLKAAQFDHATAIANAAFGEIRARRLLQPQYWQLDSGVFLVNHASHLPVDGYLRGAYCFDPLWMAGPNTKQPINNIIAGQAAWFPAMSNSTTTNSAEYTVTFENNALTRVTVLQIGTSGSPLVRSVAEKLFQWNGDLALDLPEDHDIPSRLLTRRSPTGVPLVRESQGDYSWMFTTVPTGPGPQWVLLDPDDSNSGHWIGDVQYEVSVVVFFKRTLRKNLAKERMFQVIELDGGLGGGEAQLLGRGPLDLDGVREGQWLLLTARDPANPNPNRLVAKWYRIISAGDAELDQSGTNPTMWVGLEGPDWDPRLVPNNQYPIQAIFAEDIIGVFTQTMTIARP